MSIGDWVAIVAALIGAFANIYFPHKQNQIFLRQNEIFANQAGVPAVANEGTKKPFITRFWPTVMMAILNLSIGVGIGWVIHGHYHGAALASPVLSAATCPPVASAPEQPTKFLLTIGPPDIFLQRENTLTGVLVTASIWNTGKPSIATEWSLTVTPRDGKVPVTRDSIPINPAGLRVGGVNSGFAVTQDNDISIKTKQNKITETPVDGSVRFYIPLPKYIVETSAIKLTVKDLNASEFSAVYSPR